MLTTRGIELNLNESKYIFTLNDLTFYFSSKFYLNKFKKEIESFIDIETKKLYNKFKVECDYSLMLSIALYQRIEKRGFRILNINEEPINQNELSVKF